MIYGLGNHVAGSQKVADNKRATDPKKSFTVVWNAHQATIGATVGITANAQMDITNEKGLKVEILSAPNKFYMLAEDVNIQGRRITARWTVKPVSTNKVGQQTYHVRVSYNGGLTGETSQGLNVDLVDKFEHPNKKLQNKVNIMGY